MLSVGEVSRRSGVPGSTLRYYEREGLVEAARSEGNQRQYGRDVLRRIAFIRAAQHVGLSLEEISSALGSLPRGRTPTKSDWAKLSRSWRPRLDEQISELQRLRDGLDHCIGCGCLSLRECQLSNPDDVAASLGAGARWLMGDDAHS
jgi:MerR family redox-sensitive transcriptional activator SoxR